ncbi:hypothetical protein BDV98DRAFT_577418 [Pterulicium gracile]|uniref:Uncharacterized protein n=1 Tax=Pterulicium gracile TaxID=1884261 RepID=A0A5C3Q0L1_9AGAR|nr:hypothetical protein BDV98DRAFT_577418 [Pterula gracilis]
MGGLSVEKASFAALWVETVLYGAYTVLYMICMYILIKRPRKGSRLAMIAVASALYALSSAHVILNMVRGLVAFIDEENAEATLERISSPLSVAKQVSYAVAALLADGLLIFRCFAVWARNWRIIVFPVLLFIGSTVTGFVAVYHVSQATSTSEGYFYRRVAVWGTAAYMFSLVTNIIVTGLIASRIWWMSRAVQTHLGKQHTQVYSRLIALIIESGMIYALSILVFMIAYWQNTHGHKIGNDALAQVVGIMPTLIIIRIGLGMDAHNTNRDPDGMSGMASTDMAFASTGSTRTHDGLHMDSHARGRAVVNVGLDQDRGSSSNTRSQSFSLTGSGSGTPGGKETDRLAP